MMFMFNYGTLVDPLFKDLRKFIPEFSGIKAGDKVIDVCCGTGAQVLEYGRRGAVATGIDISPGMLKIAVKNLRRQKTPNVSLQLADATSLPFPDGCFDYASISLGLHDKEKSIQYQIISEMKRVVKQDGAFIFIDYQSPLPGHVWAESARAIEYLVGGSHYWNFKDYLANGGLQDILKNNGFREECRTSFKSGLLVITKAIRGTAQ
jgi:ubiquinone/menaquinone biosynthesis C-methylase UbiE